MINHELISALLSSTFSFSFLSQGKKVFGSSVQSFGGPCHDAVKKVSIDRRRGNGLTRG